MDPISDLLEIAGEDDSLLSGGNGSTSANIFSCSPLVSIRSRPLQTAQPVEGIETNEVVSEDLTSSPKVSQQSQQKKKKKKFGGFNLRKSLAWDRAFFTEQGVLNPTELSIISGTATPNSKSNLEVIDEEELATTSTALQEIEENLFKHSSGSVSTRGKKIGAVSGLSPKPGASVKRTPPIASLAKRKVLSSNNVGNKYKRGAIPRAVPSSSTDTAKTPSEESKITRIPGPKSNVSANPTATRSGMLSSSSSKRNQNAHPGMSKNPTPSIPSLSKNPTPSIPRLSKNPTPSIPSLSKNPTPSITRLSKNPTPSLPNLSKNPTTSIPKVDMADKCSVSRTLTKHAGKLLDNSGSVPRPPSSMHQTGTVKTSGLRKPSPSIGFFSQVKASSSHSLQKSSIPCKPSESNIPKLRKLETLPVKEARSKIVKETSKNTKELSLSGVKSEAIVQIDNKQMAGVEVECDSSSFEIISKQSEVENILEDVILKSQEPGELHENKIISSMENMALPTHGKEFHTKSPTHEQLRKEADHALDNKLYDVSSNGDQSLYQEPQSTLNPTIQRISNTVQNAIGQDEDDQIKGPTGDILTFKESLILQEEHISSFKDGRHSGEFKEDSSVKSEAIMQIDNKQMAGVEVECDSSSFEKISKQVEVENILDDVILKSQEQRELHENKIISSTENMALPTHGKEFLTKSQTHEQLEKEVDHALDNKLCDVSSNGDRSLYQEPQSTLNPIIQRTSNTVQKAIGQDEDGQIKGPTGDIPTFKESLILQEEHITSFKDGSHSGEFKEDNGVKSEAIMQIDNKQMAGVGVECDSSSFEKISKQAKVENILDDVILKSQEQRELHENKIISSMENMALPTHGKEFLTKSQTHEQLEVDHALDNKLCDVSSNGDRSLYEEPQSLYEEPQSTLNPIIQRTSNTVQNAIGQDEDGQIKGPTGDIPTFKESLILQEEHRTTSCEDGKHSGEFKEDNSVKTTLLNSSLDDFSKTVPEGSKQGTPCKNTELGNYGADEFSKYEGDAQGHLLNESLTLICKKTTQSNLEAVSQQLHADPPKTLNPSGVEENGPEKENISDMNCSQSVRVTTLFSKGSPKKFILGINGASEDESKIIEIKLPVDDQSGFIPRSPLDKECDQPVHVTTLFSKGSPEKFILGINGTSEDESKIIEIKLPVDDQSGFIPRSPLDKECDQAIDSKATHDRTPELELDRLSEDCITVSASAMAHGTNINEDSHLPGFQKASAVVTVNSQDAHLDSDFLPAVIVSSTEVKDQNLVEDAFEGCGFHSNEHNATNHHIEDMLVNIDGNHDVDGKVELLQINDVKEKVEFLQINVVDEKVELLQINDVDEKVQINDVEDGNNDVDEKVKVLQINGNRDEYEKVEPLQINDVDEKVELLQINDVEDGNREVDEKVEVLQINGAKDGNHDVDERLEFLQINGAEEGSLDISPSVEIQLENVISAEFDSSTEVSEDPCCLLSEKSKLLASEDSIFSARIPQGSEVSSMKLNENAISSKLDSSVEVIESPCLLIEKSKLLASENSIFNATISQGSEVSSVKVNENAVTAELDSSVEVSEGPCLLIETIPQGDEVSSANSESFSDVAVTTVFENDKSPNTDMLSQTKDNDFPEGSEVSSMKLNENAISAESDSSIEVSEGPCLLSEKLKLLASENSIFNATISQGSEVSSMKHNENAISAELDSSIEVTEGPFTSVVAWKPEEHCPLSEIKLLASADPTFIETIPQGNEVSSMNSERFSDVAVTTVFENDGSPSTDMPIQTKDNIDFPEDKSKTIPQRNEVSSMNSERFSDVAVTTVFENDGSPSTDMPIQTKDNIDFPEDKSKTIPQRNEVSSMNSERFSDVAVTTVFENDKSPSTDMPTQTKDNIDFPEDNSKTIPEGNEVSSMNSEHFSDVAVTAVFENDKSPSTDMPVQTKDNIDFPEDNSKTIPQGNDVSSMYSEHFSDVAVTNVFENDKSPDTDMPSQTKDTINFSEDNSKTIPQGNEVSSMYIERFSDVAVTTVFENDKSLDTDMPSQTKDNIDFPEDNIKIIHPEVDASKTQEEVPIAKPPLNVAPFTEEWLAAIEAAGEEILTMKSGAVQNSPPDKVQNEPNPWSPVKKNQEIGPFDCTKITKHNIQSSDLS